jgi:hypothetical protein
MKSANYEFLELQFQFKTTIDFDESEHGMFEMTFKNLSLIGEELDYENMENEYGEPVRKFIGFEVELKRRMNPFVMKYYLPSAGIVFVSQISFLISPSQLPGRVALLVTLFLVLTNIFTRQQVLYYKSASAS